MCSQATIDDRHRPYSKSKPGASLAVVFTHGIMGSPRQFDDLVQALDDTCTIENILLPGHGGTAREYAASNLKDWQQALDDVISRLSKQYGQVILVGHSLGGLLSVSSTLKFPSSIAGLFLIAMPLQVGISRRFIKRSLVIAFGQQGKNTAADLARQTSSVSFPAWYSYMQGSGRVPELFIKSLKTRRLIGKITCPVHAVWSEQDEIVDIRSARRLPKADNFSMELLKESGHYVYTPEESQRIRESFLDFVRKLKP